MDNKNYKIMMITADNNLAMTNYWGVAHSIMKTFPCADVGYMSSKSLRKKCESGDYESLADADLIAVDYDAFGNSNGMGELVTQMCEESPELRDRVWFFLDSGLNWKSDMALYDAYNTGRRLSADEVEGLKLNKYDNRFGEDLAFVKDNFHYIELGPDCSTQRSIERDYSCHFGEALEALVQNVLHKKTLDMLQSRVARISQISKHLPMTDAERENLEEYLRAITESGESLYGYNPLEAELFPRIAQLSEDIRLDNYGRVDNVVDDVTEEVAEDGDIEVYNGGKLKIKLSECDQLRVGHSI